MFANRRSAGRQLAARLQQLREEKPVVLAVPCGGVPVGFEIAEGLDAPLDIFPAPALPIARSAVRTVLPVAIPSSTTERHRRMARSGDRPSG
jgi:hypothetical protein